MAAYHIPAYPSATPIGEDDENEIRQHWVPLLEEYDVNAAFEHDTPRINAHIYYETEKSIQMTGSCILVTVHGVEDPMRRSQSMNDRILR